ncbi:hypothetical protein [Chryseobacterium lathyri]|uniref:hypothetical protein n=1 Tax=Chryseobacterium lathyri TaxID=395933 RepID=UPI00277E16D4|nr:hypothetical protein [Chryseobacterium lathyri]MDQ0067703.1 hypothetical protein [Chryseobacterium lathyri]
MMNTKIILGLLLSISLNTLIWGQAELIPVAKWGENNDFSVNKYGNDLISVDHYRGQPNINIPLFSVEEGGLTLDISLKYKSQGVKVNKPSNWVGHDWMLEVGSINRTVKGMQFDELDFNNAEGVAPNNHDGNCYPLPSGTVGVGDFQYGGLAKGFMLTHSKINSTDNSWRGLDNLVNLMAETTPKDGGYRADYEPDIFNFSFFGHTGFFFIGPDGMWKVSSKSNLKILFDKEQDMFYGLNGFKDIWGAYPATCRIKTIGRFTIIDDKGYKYVFGDNNVRNIEMNLRDFYHGVDSLPVYANSWSIVKVYDSNNIVLYDFEHINGEHYSNYLYSNSKQYIVVPKESTDGNNPLTTTSVHPNNTTNSTAHYSSFYKASGILYIPTYPSVIRTKSGNKIDFLSIIEDNLNYFSSSGNTLLENDPSYYNNILTPPHTWGSNSPTLGIGDNTASFNKFKKRKLTTIKLTSSTGALINDIKLTHANATQRIFLYSIKNNEKTYVFNYDNLNLLPPLLSNKTDMWGYYNNIPYKIHVDFGSTKTYWNNFENNKFGELQVNTPYLYYGTLKEIYWPTGGKTVLDWESNSFTTRVYPKSGNLVSANLPGGGARIKKITSDNTTKEFFYTNSFNEMDYNISSGILVNEPIFYDNSNKALEILGFYNNSNANPSFPNNTYIGNIMGINPKSIFEPSDVVYSSVFEKSNDGYTHYNFSTHFDVPDNYYPGIIPSNNTLGLTRNDLSNQRGLLLRKDFYDNSQKIIKRIDFKYIKTTNLLGRGVSYDLFSTSTYVNCYFCITNASPYEIDYSDNLLSEIFTTEFFKDGRNLQYLKKYYYQNPVDPSYNLIDKIEEYPNKFDLSKFKSVKFQYATDMGTSSQLFSDMIAKNMIGIPLSATKYNEAQQPISRSETIFAKNSTTNNLILPISTRSIKTGVIDYGSDSSVDTKVTYDLYDAHGRVLQYTDASGIPTTIIWGYNKSQPIAKIVGATYNYVSTNTNIGYLQDASDVDVDTASENILISLLDDLRKNIAFKDYQITTYTYDPLIGITSLTNPDGLRENYKYHAQTHKLEKVIDVDSKVREEYKYHYKN